jgi:hypothetical protein
MRDKIRALCEELHGSTEGTFREKRGPTIRIEAGLHSPEYHIYFTISINIISVLFVNYGAFRIVELRWLVWIEDVALKGWLYKGAGLLAGGLVFETAGFGKPTLHNPAAFCTRCVA